jgi:hypothetical protein
LFPYFKMLSLKASYVLSFLWLRKTEQLLKASLTGHTVLLIHDLQSARGNMYWFLCQVMKTHMLPVQFTADRLAYKLSRSQSAPQFL